MLTEALIEAAAPNARAYKLADSKGLYLFVTPAGSKSWRMKYRFERKERCLTFGLYPSVGLASARALRDRAKALLSTKQDPRVALEYAAKREAAELIASPSAGGGERQVYFVRAPNRQIKIGVSNDVRRRVAQLQMRFTEPLEIIGTLTGGYATEGTLHQMFAESAVGGEWFDPSIRLLEFIDENAEPFTCL